jgi:lipoic acid synthetase
MDLRHVVITSVTRDDLPDGGAAVFARCVDLLRRHLPESRVEVLIPDFSGNWEPLSLVLESGPDVINHNMEVVRPLYHNLRPQGNYERSLELLRRVRESRPSILTKSGFMVGFGENCGDIKSLIDDLASVGCNNLTIGQYLQPTRDHWPVKRYYWPEEFDQFAEMAYRNGFKRVESGPLVRSSYHAAKY